MISIQLSYQDQINNLKLDMINFITVVQKLLGDCRSYILHIHLGVWVRGWHLFRSFLASALVTRNEFLIQHPKVQLAQKTHIYFFRPQVCHM